MLDTEWRDAPLEDVLESETNPRKTFDEGKLEELAESVGEHGVLQPCVARPHPTADGKLELVCGARRFRAAGLALLHTLPVVVRELTDAQVLEIQLVENCQREDVPPLEEADGLLLLHRDHGLSAEVLGEKIGRSPGYVLKRLHLQHLGPDSRNALQAGKLSVGVAEIIARVPDPTLQDQLLDDLLQVDAYYAAEPPTVREARDLVHRRYMLQLAKAQFDVGDAELVPKAGACTSCPKRTGAQPLLFEEVKEADTCTDTACFAQKKEATWAQAAAAAEKAGQRVLSDAEAKKVFSEYSTCLPHNSRYVDLEERCHEVSKARSWRRVIGKKRMPPVIITRDRNGDTRELVLLEDVKKAIKAAPGKDDPGKRNAPGTGAFHRDVAKDRLDAKVKAETDRRVGAALVEAVEHGDVLGEGAEFWRILTRGIVLSAWAETVKETAKRRGLLGDKGVGRGEAELLEAITTMEPPQLIGLIADLVAQRVGHVPGGKLPKTELAELLGIDLKAIARKARADLKPKKKPAKRKAAKKPAKKATGK